MNMMTIYKIKYERTAEYTMIVEANSAEEAKQKYEDFDIIDNYETQGVSEELLSIKKIRDED